jgi:hypothetical protein
MPQEEVGPFVSKIKEIFSKIFGIPIPTIAALDGKLHSFCDRCLKRQTVLFSTITYCGR